MNILEYIPSFLLLGLLGLLLWKRAFRTFPWFLAYVVFGVAADILRFASRGYVTPYFWTYWLTEAGYGLLGIFAIYEVLRTVLGNLIRAWWAHAVFISVLVIGIFLSIARSHMAPATAPDRLMQYIIIGEMAVRISQVLIFAGLASLTPILGLSWKQQGFGIATGFGIYSTVILLTTTKFSDFGTRFIPLWSLASLVAYSIAVLIWIWFFSVPQETDTSGPLDLAPSPGELERYKETLRRMR